MTGNPMTTNLTILAINAISDALIDLASGHAEDIDIGILNDTGCAGRGTIQACLAAITVDAEQALERSAA